MASAEYLTNNIAKSLKERVAEYNERRPKEDTPLTVHKLRKLYKSMGIKKKRVQKQKYMSKKWTKEAKLIKFRSMLEDLITYEN